MTSKTIYTDSYRDLISLLRQTREKAGITQDALAKALGEDQSFVSKIEGRERRLDIDELRRFCNVLDIPLIKIIGQWVKIIQIQHGSATKSLVSEAPPVDSDWSETNWAHDVSL